VLAALASFFVPGLGQLGQGRILTAITHFVLAVVLWFVLLGWVVHLWSVVSAATYKPKPGLLEEIGKGLRLKKCPFCKMEIDRKAVVCPYCQSKLA
jgi:hypothetical protein